MEVTGLSASTSYYFAMKVEDENMAASPISNVVSATTDGPDTTPPADITDLRGGPPVNLMLVPAPAVDASSEAQPKENTTDGSLTTHWASVGSSIVQDEWVTVDTGALRLLGRVRLRSRTTGSFFPEDGRSKSVTTASTSLPWRSFSGCPRTSPLGIRSTLRRPRAVSYAST